MSSIDSTSAWSVGSAVQKLLLEIASNIGAVADASSSGQSNAEAPFLLADSPSAANLAPNTLALSLFALRTPQAALADSDLPIAQTSLAQTVLGQTAPGQAMIAARNADSGPQANTTQSAASSRGGGPSNTGPGAAMNASANSLASATAPSMPDALQGTLNGLQHLATNPALLSDGGIMASLIVNAGMMSGLQQQPFNIPVAVALPGAAATDDEQALTYLANLGANEVLLEKMRKLLKKKPPGKQLLVGLAALMTAIGVVRQVLTGELRSALEDRQVNEEAHTTAESRGYRGQRRRLYLE